MIHTDLKTKKLLLRSSHFLTDVYEEAFKTEETLCSRKDDDSMQLVFSGTLIPLKVTVGQKQW